MRIAVSVGHQCGDPGKDIEWPANQKTATLLHSILTINGFQAEIFEGNLPTRVNMINAYGPELAIECHFNQLEWPFNPTKYGSGYETVIHKGSMNGKLLATAILEEFEMRLPTFRRSTGIIERDDLYFNKHTKCPACIIEPLFLDNPAESRFLDMPRGFDFIAQAAYQGVVKYLERRDSRPPVG